MLLFLDPALYISEILDGTTFHDGLSIIFGQWSSKPHIQVMADNGWDGKGQVGCCLQIMGWLFKLILWGLRYFVK